MSNIPMSNIPSSVNARDLFWLWYDRLNLEERKDIVQNYNRFVRQVELETSLQEMLSSKSPVPSYNPGWADTCGF
ncbi:MAG: hypothetical protein SFW36_18120 [Leptolyngbyaceae cyanobacterium bins.59]|nr:hypothetical protein [Leptolyngbyaceae cyanobacterium bins.59]